MKSGDMVKFIDSANENTPGWGPNLDIGLVVMSTGDKFGPQHWYYVLFDKEVTRVFHKDIELIPEEE